MASFNLPLFVVLVLWSSLASCKGGEIEFISEVGGREVTYSIDSKVINQSPRWKPSQSSPPLTARKAIAIARLKRPDVSLKVIEKRDADAEWALQSASLRPFADRWFWIISYERVPAPGSFMTGVQERTEIVILMNGRVVYPKGTADVSTLNGPNLDCGDETRDGKAKAKSNGTPKSKGQEKVTEGINGRQPNAPETSEASHLVD